MVEVNVYAFCLLLSLAVCSVLFFAMWFFRNVNEIKHINDLERQVRSRDQEISNLEDDLELKFEIELNKKVSGIIVKNKYLQKELDKSNNLVRLIKNLSYCVRDLDREFKKIYID